MRMQLSGQAREILGNSELVVITERVDDVALLIGQMVKMGLPDSPISNASRARPVGKSA